MRNRVRWSERVRWCDVVHAATVLVGIAAAGVVLSTLQAAEPQTVNSPLSPEASLAAFAVDPGVKIELVAAEPEVIDPVAVAFGADGRLWVVEMRDYPHGPEAGGKPKSRIKCLQDKDGDGRFETATVFADEQLFVTGVLPYRDGLIATLAGQIMFFADRDGDGVAEIREPWFSGFAEQNSQLRANHPTFGPDGYVYVANGLRGGKIVPEKAEWKRDREPVTITGFDFKFHPETGDFATVNGHGQFGMSFDDYGHRFVCSNRNPCMQIVLDDRYIKQNPLFGVRQVVQDVCQAGEASQLFPISRAWTTSTLHANQFTAACGVTLYRGDGLPADFYGNAFTCDPTGNLVHREVLTVDGATFAGKSPYDHREFLASPDTWFRPVNLAHGPDGALYVVDMYRAVIEHPDFMPTELKTRPDLMLGTDRGRIYRVIAQTPASRTVATSTPESSADWLALLNHPNSFQRETALRRLVETTADRMPAETVLQASATWLPYGRTAALRLLSQWKLLSEAAVVAAFADPAPEVRETALILAEPLIESARVREGMLALTNDGQPRVRFQAVQSLTMGPADDALLAALSEVSLRDAGDPWLRSAVMTAARDQSAALLARLLAAAAANNELQAGLLTLCADLSTVAAGPTFDTARTPVWTALLALPAAGTQPQIDDLRWSVLNSLAEVFRRRGQTLGKSAGFPADADQPVSDWLNAAVVAAANTELKGDTRLIAIQLTRFAPVDQATESLLDVALNDPDPGIQQAAFETLATYPQVELAAPLLARFAESAPNARRGILDVLLANEGRTETLVAALESGEIKPTELDPIRVQRLTNHRNKALQERSRKVLEAATAERGAVIASYQSVLTMKADPRRGKAIFEKQCVTCHRVGELGVNVGPDIADSRTKTPDVLLTAILDPNRAIDNNFFGYTVVTVEGKVLTGIITAETSASITLRQPEGKTETILRSDIDVLRNTGMSLMPVGFEKNISQQQMADLVSFLKNWRYLDGTVPEQVIQMP